MNRRSISKRPLQFLVGLAFVILSLLASSGSNSLRDGAGAVQAAPLQQTFPVVVFEDSSYIITEPDDTNTVDVTISVLISEAPAAGEEAKVTYSTADGTARAGTDYEQTDGTLTFPVGSTDAQTFTVKIFGNNLAQPNRSFIVILTNPVNATVGIAGSTTTVTIVDNDEEPPTSTPTATPGGDIFLDKYEPNNVFDTAFETSANATKLTDITLWPVGDVDFFQFFGKDGSTYQVFTTDLDAGLDTSLKVYDPDGEKFAENDDIDVANNRSQVEFRADDDGFYFAKITNKEPSDPTNKTYSFGVNEIVPPTPTATATRVGQLDDCEENNSIGTACLIGDGAIKSNMNFVPPQGTGTDNDFYRLPVKPGVLYTCETTNLSPPNDTNIIFLDHNGNDFNPPLGNDDRALGDPSSLLSWYSTYQGNLYVLVGPVNPPPYDETPLYTYDIVCNGVAATPTPPPTSTVVWVPPPSTGGGPIAPTATAFVYPTFPPTPTAIDFADLLPTAIPPPVVGFRPLPTATPVTAVVKTTTVQVTVYYDSNFNFTPELTEGIMDVAVELYDNASGDLLAFGYSNEAGVVRFDSIASSGAVRVEVAYLNYSQVVVGASANILLRVEPRPLPSDIP
ncbi:MAG: hypothetical protein GWP61_14590 [Chloroflexi bacterium]|jgi:hypothetical protein|nr:hypothetical protein [Chloroflexota bacterium]